MSFITLAMNMIIRSRFNNLSKKKKDVGSTNKEVGEDISYLTHKNSMGVEYELS